VVEGQSWGVDVGGGLSCDGVTASCCPLQVKTDLVLKPEALDKTERRIR